MGLSNRFNFLLKLSYFCQLQDSGTTISIEPKFVAMIGWLVVWNMFFPYIGNNHPNWLSYFSEGLKPPTSWHLVEIEVLKHGMAWSPLFLRQNHWIRWENCIIDSWNRPDIFWFLWLNAMVFPTNSMKARTSLQAEVCWVSKMGMPATVGWGSSKRSPNVSTISRGYWAPISTVCSLQPLDLNVELLFPEAVGGGSKARTWKTSPC